jgi:catechol 2,3-dioxygenase-like lactoylglutathione lyase family enzyme
MDSIISHLLNRFEQGALTRRELAQGLTMLAAAGTTAAVAQEAVDFKTADIDHISIHVADMQRSIDFYKKMFGFTVVSEDKPREIVRLGNKGILVSLNHGGPAGVIDHYAIGIPRFNKDAVEAHFKARGATPLQGDYAGLHVKDPDGINVQVSAAGGTGG